MVLQPKVAGTLRVPSLSAADVESHKAAAHRLPRCLLPWLAPFWWAVSVLLVLAGGLRAEEPNRSPVDLVLTPDEAWLVTVNQSSTPCRWSTWESGQVVDEVACGRRPSALALVPNGHRVL